MQDTVSPSPTLIIFAIKSFTVWIGSKVLLSYETVINMNPMNPSFRNCRQFNEENVNHAMRVRSPAVNGTEQEILQSLFCPNQLRRQQEASKEESRMLQVCKGATLHFYSHSSTWSQPLESCQIQDRGYLDHKKV